MTFDDPRNQPYQDRIRWAWREAGAESFGIGLVRLTVIASFRRPDSHWTARGELSAAGKRALNPSRADVDNLAKNVMDALNGLAWVDDRQVVELLVTKDWSDESCLTVMAERDDLPDQVAT